MHNNLAHGVLYHLTPFQYSHVGSEPAVLQSNIHDDCFQRNGAVVAITFTFGPRFPHNRSDLLYR